MEEYKNYSPDVANILASLAKRETHYFSGRLQKNLIDTLSDGIRMLHNPARHADFVVLRSFDTPSVLVEMGFMSHEADERLLQSYNHRARVMAAIHAGIDSYMSRSTEHAKAG